MSLLVHPIPSLPLHLSDLLDCLYVPSSPALLLHLDQSLSLPVHLSPESDQLLEESLTLLPLLPLLLLLSLELLLHLLPHLDHLSLGLLLDLLYEIGHLLDLGLLVVDSGL